MRVRRPRGRSGEVVAKTFADQVYTRLRRDIILGELPPGLKLRMGMLTRRYNVGLSPLREALVRLTGDALAIAEGQRGFWVAPVSAEDVRDTVETRLLIETQALSLSLEKGGAEWEQGVRSAYAELAQLDDQLETADAASRLQYEAANRRFHEALVAACGSPWLIRLRSMLHQHSERAIMISLAQVAVGRPVHDEHHAIFEAAMARRTLRACQVTEIHLKRTLDVVLAALQRQAARQASPARRSRSAGPR